MKRFKSVCVLLATPNSQLTNQLPMDKSNPACISVISKAGYTWIYIKIDNTESQHPFHDDIIYLNQRDVSAQPEKPTTQRN